MIISKRRQSGVEPRPAGSAILPTQPWPTEAAMPRVHPFSVNAAEPARRKFLSLAAGAATLPAILFLVPALGVFESFAEDDEKFYTECVISQGDSINKIKQFYSVPADPRKMAPPTPYRYQYHLEQYGIWVFFDELMQVSSLRFDAPFRGPIGGIAIGDTAERLSSLRGEPARKFSGLPDLTQEKEREQQVQALLKALPDPVPKSKVLETFAEINRIRTSPIKYNTAWLYDPDKPSFIRYDIGPDGNRVQSILVRSCSPG